MHMADVFGQKHSVLTKPMVHTEQQMRGSAGSSPHTPRAHGASKVTPGFYIRTRLNQVS
jgi:hypothetical protein